MITTYGYLDQYQIAGLNTYPSWFGIGLIAVTPSCRNITIAAENRNVDITAEDRNVSITC